MESSLFSTAGNPCSRVSQYRDDLIVLRYLVEFQEHIKRRLDRGIDHPRNRLRQVEEFLQ